jgi:hypothetical protein
VLRASLRLSKRQPSLPVASMSHDSKFVSAVIYQIRHRADFAAVNVAAPVTHPGKYPHAASARRGGATLNLARACRYEEAAPPG